MRQLIFFGTVGGNPVLAESKAALGYGESMQQNIASTSGSYAAEDFSFITSQSPNGMVTVSKIDQAPYNASLLLNVFGNNKFWTIRNYGTAVPANTGFGSSVTINPTSDTVATTPVYVKFAPTASGLFTANVLIDAENVGQKLIPVTATSIVREAGRGNALKLLGTKSNVAISGFSTFQPTEFTVEFWMKPISPLISAFNAQTQLMGNTGQFIVRCNNATDKILEVGVNTGTSIKSPVNTLILNEWIHVAYTYKITAPNTTGAANLYINGKNVGTQPTVAKPSAWSSFRLGSSGTSFGGEIDELRVWEKERTEQQIQENIHLIKDVRTACTEGLISYFQFGENVGTLANNTTLADVLKKGTATVKDISAETTMPEIVASDAPVGFGNSETQTVTATGNYNYPNVKASINFNSPVPNGKIVISQITDTPTAPPSGTLANTYWVIDNQGTTTTGLNADVTFTPQAGFVTNLVASNYQYYKRETNGYGAWQTPVAATSVTSNTVTFSGVPSFSQFVLAKTNTVLPLELLYFTGNRTDKQVNLAWQTAYERNFSHFEVQRSADAKTFDVLKTVKPNPSMRYFITDFESLQGINYYRLKMVDNDGTEALSKTLSFSNEGKNKVKIYPTATDGQLIVEGAASFDIFNGVGQVVLSSKQHFNNAHNVLNLAHLTNGIYFVKGVDTEGGTFVEKIVKK